ncbi:MAG: hypothetical protein EOM13_06880 [Clostridia bacterium]|nr:hypothetical protein [Clostridia bacterium]
MRYRTRPLIKPSKNRRRLIRTSFFSEMKRLFIAIDLQVQAELIRHLLDGEAGGPGRLEIEPEAMALMDAYEWPGNIRQLRNTLRTLVGLSEGGVIRVDDLPDDLLLGEESLDRPARPSNPLDVAERDAILRELEAAHWNVTRVASKLTLSRNTLYRKMKRYRIKPPR